MFLYLENTYRTLEKVIYIRTLEHKYNVEQNIWKKMFGQNQVIKTIGVHSGNQFSKQETSYFGSWESFFDLVLLQ